MACLKWRGGREWELLGRGELGLCWVGVGMAGMFLGAACPALLLPRDGAAAFTPSAGVLNPFRLALLPENREGLNYEDLEHASFHGVAKDICLSTL